MRDTIARLTRFEDKVAKLFEKGKIHVPIHLSGSVDGTYEEFLVNLFKQVDKNDYVFCTWRNHMHYLLKGGSEKALLHEILGKDTGICGGKAGSMHIIDHKLRFYSSAIVAGMCSIAVGVAKAIKLRGNKERVWCFLGDGSVDSGHFWEAYRYAYGHMLLITFVIEDNDRSVCTSICQRWGLLGGIHLDINIQGPLIEYIAFKPKYPHAGIGKYIAL
jgi:TPP-dependent pyruvate/acetoin dehydrogenase alpha subunit